MYVYNRRGVLSTTATLLSLRDISPDRGISRFDGGGFKCGQTFPIIKLSTLNSNL